MAISAARLSAAATDVHCDDAVLRVTLADGREISAPLEWFPRLRDADAAERSRWRLIGRGEGIHWEGLDEDISVNALLGLPS